MILLPPFEYCPSCGYSLEGLPLDYRCPECAFAFDSQMVIFRPRYLGALYASIALPSAPVLIVLASQLFMTGPRVFGRYDTILYCLAIMIIGAIIAAVRISRLRRRGVFVAVGGSGISVRSVGDVCSVGWDRISELSLQDRPPWFKVSGERNAVRFGSVFDQKDEEAAFADVTDALRKVGVGEGDRAVCIGAERIREIVESHLSKRRRLIRGAWPEARGLIIGGAAAIFVGLALLVLAAVSSEYDDWALLTGLALPVGLVTMMAGLSRLTGGR